MHIHDLTNSLSQEQLRGMTAANIYGGKHSYGYSGPLTIRDTKQINDADGSKVWHVTDRATHGNIINFYVGGYYQKTVRNKIFKFYPQVVIKSR